MAFVNTASAAQLQRESRCVSCESWRLRPGQARCSTDAGLRKSLKVSCWSATANTKSGGVTERKEAVRHGIGNDVSESVSRTTVHTPGRRLQVEFPWASAWTSVHAWTLMSSSAMAEVTTEAAGSMPQTFEPRGITVVDTFVFMAGTVPFAVATWQFWTRIAKGKPFGTGRDSVIIDTGRQDWDTDNPDRPKTGARRVLSAGALRVAYILMAAAGLSYLLVALSGLQVSL
ncbi:hypothetical protein FVE85_0505 [Porphyridium purpureum]|uniref:Uncharacterized protein n=1 Tax=Porphyridium purpureum TaxID=35688 RepID=A0A5J4YZM4_PORPP|nr:hypothetical protein FVE85_0505 [Porphyridium purpureum]|eukprot:POR2103..scf208_2